MGILSRMGKYFYVEKGTVHSETELSSSSEKSVTYHSAEFKTQVQEEDEFHTPTHVGWENQENSSGFSDVCHADLGSKESLEQVKQPLGSDKHNKEIANQTESSKDGATSKATRTESVKSTESEERVEGPDTSSFAAFLLSLLSITPQYDLSASESSDEDYSDEEPTRTQQGDAQIPSSSYYSWSRLGLGFYGKSSNSAAQETIPSPFDSAKPKETPTVEGQKQTTAASYLRWMGFYRNIDSSKVMEKLPEDSASILQPRSDLSHFQGSDHSPCVRDGEPHQGKLPGTPRSPLKLPAMSEESFLLTEQSRTLIYSALPALAQGREWVLLYSTIKHGISLRTLYRRSELATGPCLLAVEDSVGAVFGGLSSGPLKPSTKRKYQGGSECFVFSDANGMMTLYRASGKNRYFVLCMNEALALGGGGHFALQIEGELLRGTSGSCETFESPCLAKNEEFQVKQVELWGFAHNSRYTPKSAHWHEPEAAPGIHTW